MDDQKILPPKETIRRAYERASALYEPSQGNRNISRQRKGNSHGRDISEYQVNEPAPTEEEGQNIFARLMALAANVPGTLATLRKHIGQWARWLRLGISTIKSFETSVQTL
jgi:hypothetical protein